MVPPVQSPMTIADYCAAMDRGEIETNSEYQRSDKVWPPAARSFLVETILLGFPIPKIFLFQMLDLKSKKTVKEIVDGQQRSKTISDFFHNKLKISQSSELVGARARTYDQLAEELQGRFLNYQLSIDLFVSVSPSEIREAFRRLNSYTVPLNPEELRHAEYQGVFKWFIYHLTREFEEIFLSLGVMTQKNIIRMQDTKLLAECVHSLIHGIQTTKSKELNKLYSDYEKVFADQEAVDGRLKVAIQFIVELPEIHNGPLMAPHIFYALVLAVNQIKAPLDSLRPAFDAPHPFVFNREVAITNLTELGAALEAEIPEQRFMPFVSACSSKTNVDTQRSSRVAWLGKALLPDLL
jgi:hypothetical protein